MAASKILLILAIAGMVAAMGFGSPVTAGGETIYDHVYNPGKLKPTDSSGAVKVGDKAPDFTLKDLNGKHISLSRFRGKKNVVLSFVPAAWTPVCSKQWPGYNIAKEFFDENDAVLIGITVDNAPTLFAWTKEMGDLWFPVVSDFWPHGAVARALWSPT